MKREIDKKSSITRKLRTTNSLFLLFGFLILASIFVVHNAMAAPLSKDNVIVSLFINPKSVSSGGIFAVNGTLTDTTTGKPLGGMTISFIAPSPIFIPNVITDNNGNYLVSGLKAPTTAGSYSIKAKFVGGTIYRTYSSTKILQVIPTTTTSKALPLTVSTSASTTTGVSPLTVRFVTTVSGGSGVYFYSWDFGDGSTSTMQNPSHNYSTGTYTAKITVKDSNGNTDSSSISIVVVASFPPITTSVSSNSTTGTAPLGVSFTSTPGGGSGTYTYSWDFGDGSTSTMQNPTHTYSAAGTYNSKATVTDSLGKTRSSSISITVTAPIPPVTVSASASATSGSVPFTVTFTGTPSGGSGTYSYSWDFGDGSTSTMQNPTHTYSAAGTYNSKATVTDSLGKTRSSSISITVTAPIPPVTVSASASATSGSVPFTVTFTGTPSGGSGTYSYSWDFGDGSTSTMQNPTHTYSAAGTYNAIDTVNDGNGKTGSATTQVIATASVPSGHSFAISQANLWVNQTSTKGYSWGALGITNNGTNNISISSILVAGNTVPYSNWYVDTNKTELTSVNFQWPYIMTSMDNNGFLKDSGALSPNGCAANSNKLRLDFDGAGKNPALCLTKQSSQVSLSPGQSMLVYFKVPNGIVMPTNIGTSQTVKVSDGTDSTTQNVQVKNLNNFNLRFWLHTNQQYYTTSLNIFTKYLKSGDYIMIGSGMDGDPTISLQQANQAKSLFKPGVHALSYRIYFSIKDMLSEVPTLPKGYDLIVYDYEKGDSPDFTTDMTKSLAYFSQANSVISQYNQKTGSNAKLMAAISYPPIRWSTTPWDWGTVAAQMSQINVMMSGYYSSPCLAQCSSSAISQIRVESPSAVNEIQLSMSGGRGTPNDIAPALYIAQGVGVDTTLVFYDNNQTNYLQQLFDLLRY